MPQCPKCKAEYPPDAAQCLVCGIALIGKDRTDGLTPLPASQGGPLYGCLQLPLMCLLALASIIGGVAIGTLMTATGIVNGHSRLGQMAEVAVPLAVVGIALFVVGYTAGTRLSWHWVSLGWAIVCVPIAYAMIAVSHHAGQQPYPTTAGLFLLTCPTCAGATSILSGKAFKRSRRWWLLTVPAIWILSGIIAFSH